MNQTSISLAQTGYYSKLIIDYVENKASLKPFYNQKLSLENAPQLIEQRNKFAFPAREILTPTLLKQYQGIEISPESQQNIQHLSLQNTYTITTGHQLNLMSGPLYFIYKIASCIKLCQQLQAKHPNYNFVPIYWMNSEDHDIAEINYFNLFGNKITWNLDWNGAAGKMPTQSLQNQVFPQLKNILGNAPKAEQIIDILQNCYLQEPTLERATLKFINHLFGKYGLVILNQNEQKFKQTVNFLVEKELLNNDNQNLVNTLSSQLIEAGYHAQVNARATNLFLFTQKGSRERIEIQENKSYKLLPSQQVYSHSQMLDILHTDSTKFSFNVVTRTLYQQILLPNLAYIGGGGELAYWLQYKKLFEANQVFYPSLILRNTVLFVTETQQKKLDTIGLQALDFFTDINLLKKKFVQNHSEANLNLNNEKQEINQIFNKIKAKILQIDATLERSATAELSKLLSQLENLEDKMLRAEKRKYEQTLAQIEGLYASLFPNNSLQERHDNFIEIWFHYGLAFIDNLIENLNPNQDNFTLLFA